MSELWRDLVRRYDSRLAEQLSLSRVVISRKTGDMRVEVNAERLLKKSEMDAVSTSLTEAFPGAPVRLKVRYPALRSAVEADVGQVSRLLMDLIAEESPGSRHFLDWDESAWKLDNGALTLSVPSEEGATYVKMRKIDRMLEGLLEDLFSVRANVRVQVAGDEERRLLEIAERRARTEELLAQEMLNQQQKTPASKPQPTGAVYGKSIADAPIQLGALTEDAGRVTVVGEVLSFDLRDAKNGQLKICQFSITDRTGSVNCKVFLSARRGEDRESLQKIVEEVSGALKPGQWVKVRGNYKPDDFSREMVLQVTDIMSAVKPVREDNAREKRVELHAHTQMSAMDATVSPTDLIKRAASWGHKAIAITDHGVVQAFPEAFSAAKKAGIKLIPGCEGYLIEDMARIVESADGRALSDCAFVVLDVETTGLNTMLDEIIEIGAVRIEGGRETAEFSRLINPGRTLPEKITELTGITDAMLVGEPRLADVMPEFAAFCEGAVLVAHNAAFDMAFMRRAFLGIGREFEFAELDTLALAQNLYPNFKNHKLGTLCKMLGVNLTNAHRAVHDARATGLVMQKMLEALPESVRTLNDLNQAFRAYKGGKSYHIILLAESQKGMENLYRLVSEGHLNYFHRTPRIPRSLIEKYREGLILGSACESGELFRAIVAGKKDEELEAIARFYDYLEIQPIGNNAFLQREGVVRDEDGLRDLNRKVVELGDKLGIPVAATGDVHFLEETDAVYRTILMASKGFEDADIQPPLYFKTTEEMLDEFSYLGRETARRVVVDTPNVIADRIGEVSMFIKHPEGKETFQPFWPEAEEELVSLTMNKAHAIYGEELPEIVQARIDKELNAIIGYGFSTLYMIAVKLVKKSLSDGYIVGSRGSVGSSLVAFLSGITEVNSLPPHYVCPHCKHTEFEVPEAYACGLDLPVKRCPECGEWMDKDGFNIPFEVFLGFKGDKVPDIDLNFSGEYQPTAHAYVKELFGTENVFRAGTIGSIAEKTAFGYVKKYLEERNLSRPKAEMDRLARGITGVKRTTGQHPAGMVVLPKEYEIYQFTPIQHPADDQSTETVTTHFDFNSMHDVLVKLDILGHDDPTMLRKLQDLTGIAPQDVPLHDPEVFSKIISLFSGTDALGISAEELGVTTGTLGIPEFGTPFVRGMLKETKPTSMEELIRISGLSHGTDVWLGNTQDLVRAGVALKDCICTRDDIMNQLIRLKVEPEVAFRTMESVRKGKGLQDYMEKAIVESDAPEWFVDSCKKIGYMFPKAHAVAYVTMALRIAYFKIFYPTEYYSCYLMRNAESFDGVTMTTDSIDALRVMQEGISSLEKEERERKSDEMSMLEILIEMRLRGVRVLGVDIYRSHATDFQVVGEKEILPPISSLPGVGQAAAEAFVQARAAGPFVSQDEMAARKVSASTIEQLRLAGCLKDIPVTTQVTLFEYMA